MMSSIADASSSDDVEYLQDDRGPGSMRTLVSSDDVNDLQMMSVDGPAVASDVWND
eukprot:gene26726-4296_t